MSNVINFTGNTKLDSEKVLDDAKKKNLDDVLVLGWLPNGNMYLSSSTISGPEILWLLENARLALMEDV